MKCFVICIVIILLLLAGCWYCMDTRMKKQEDENKLAIAEAVQFALDSAEATRALHPPPTRTHIVYVEKPAPKPKKVVVENEPNVFTDARDGQIYSFIEVGDVLWMVENLKFVDDQSWCYDNSPDNCNPLGRLYTWNAAMRSCPEGWRLPNDDEWAKLIRNYGGISLAGAELKVEGTSGFNALMAGYRDKAQFFGKKGESAYFWSATEQSDIYASFRGLYSEVDNIGPYTYTKPDAFSVRCIKNAE